jgi:hypothetical protein
LEGAISYPVNAIGLWGGVPGEGFAEAALAARPLRAGPIVKWFRQQTEISPRAPVRTTRAGHTQNGLGMKSWFLGKWPLAGIDVCVTS